MPVQGHYSYAFRVGYRQGIDDVLDAISAQLNNGNKKALKESDLKLIAKNLKNGVH